MKLVISGASGKTGFRAAEEAIKKGHKVHLLLRKNSIIPKSLEKCDKSIISLWHKNELDQVLRGNDGLIIATGLIFVYKIPTIPVRYLFSVFLIISIGSVATYFTVTNSYRTMLYINAIPDALIAFQNSSELPSLIQAQIVNIYPIWLRFTEIINLNFLPTILGTGLGTASLANSIFFDGYGVHNPFANIIRVVFEAGMIGTLLFINAFLRPITTMVKNREVKEKITIFMLFILGLNFGHRSATVFIFLGMLLLIFNYKKEFVR